MMGIATFNAHTFIDSHRAIFEFGDGSFSFNIYADGRIEKWVTRTGDLVPKFAGVVVNRIRPTLDYLIGQVNQNAIAIRELTGSLNEAIQLKRALESAELERKREEESMFRTQGTPFGPLLYVENSPEPFCIHRFMDQLSALKTRSD